MTKRRPAAAPSPVTVSSRTVRAEAHRVAGDMVERLLGKAYAVIDASLSETREVAVLGPDGLPLYDDTGDPVTETVGGDVQTARWLVDRTLPTRTQARLSVPVEADLDTSEGMVAAARQVVSQMLSAEISIRECAETLDALIKYGSIRAYLGVEELRELLDAIERKDRQPMAERPVVIQWGRAAQANGHGT